MQFIDANGNPLVGGKLYTYASGTTTPLATYTDATAATPNTNPVIMDSRGECSVWLGASSYSLTLKDSLDSLIWTADEINGLATAGSLSTYIALLTSSAGAANIGFIQAGAGAAATTAQAKLRERVSVKDFGAVGNGSTDDTTAIQAGLTACTGKELYFPAGTYIVSTTLTVKTKTTLVGDGINKSILKLASGASASASMLTNFTISGTANVYYDTDIEVTGLTFDGNSNATRTSELLGFAKVQNLYFHGNSVQNSTFIGLATSAGINSIITENLFTNCGRPQPSTTSAPAFWCATTAQGTSYDVRVDGNYFYYNLWSAAYFMPTRGSFSNNICISNGESTIFSNSTGAYLRIENNQITGAIRSNISGSGIECGASHTIIQGNMIDSCASDGISLTAVQNCIIANNQIFNNGQETAYYPYACGIAILTDAVSPGQPDHIDIHDNRIGDRQASKTQYAAIGLGHYGSGSPITNLAIHHNDFSEQKTATYYNFSATTYGTGSYTANNYIANGALEPPFKYVTFTTNSSTGDQAITGVGFRLRAIEIIAVIASTTQSFQSVGWNDGNGGSCVYTAVDGTGKRSGQTTGIIAIKDGGGTALTSATIVSADVDGFTFNLSVATSVAVCIAKCFP